MRLQGPVPIAGPREDGLRNPGNEYILTTQFSQFNLSAPLMARLNANNFVTPTPVQAGCIPPALEGRDVLATAQTGTGKTLGFLIPIVEMLQKAAGPERGAGTHSAAHARTGHAGGEGFQGHPHQLRSRPWPWWLAACRSARSSMPFAAARG